MSGTDGTGATDRTGGQPAAGEAPGACEASGAGEVAGASEAFRAREVHRAGEVRMAGEAPAAGKAAGAGEVLGADEVAGPVDVAVTEDVWASALAELATRRPVIRCGDAWQDRDRLVGVASQARALVVRNRTMVDEDLLSRCPRLQIVARAGVGLDNIDVAAADRAGVVVTAPLGANAVSVAEHTIGLALALARGTVALDADCRAGNWSRRPGRELRGRTWGLVGAGATARACGELATALGLRVLAYDPYVDPRHPGLARAGITLAPLADVVAAADVLSCHLPGGTETTGLVGRDLIAGMRPDALFINVGRGEVVDEDALADALESGAIAGAALDVRAQEPPGRGRIEKLGNVILTPHIAGITAESQQRIMRVLADDIEAVLSGAEAASAVGTSRKARS